MKRLLLCSSLSLIFACAPLATPIEQGSQNASITIGGLPDNTDAAASILNVSSKDNKWDFRLSEIEDKEFPPNVEYTFSLQLVASDGTVIAKTLADNPRCQPAVKVLTAGDNDVPMTLCKVTGDTIDVKKPEDPKPANANLDIDLTDANEIHEVSARSIFDELQAAVTEMRDKNVATLYDAFKVKYPRGKKIRVDFIPTNTGRYNMMYTSLTNLNDGILDNESSYTIFCDYDGGAKEPLERPTKGKPITIEGVVDFVNASITTNRPMSGTIYLDDCVIK